MTLHNVEFEITKVTLEERNSCIRVMEILNIQHLCSHDQMCIYLYIDLSIETLANKTLLTAM